MILNDRLVARPEEHDLRDQVSAGFWPCHSPIDYLFALCRFNDRAMQQQRRCFCCLHQKADDALWHDLL